MLYINPTLSLIICFSIYVKKIYLSKNHHLRFKWLPVLFPSGTVSTVQVQLYSIFYPKKKKEKSCTFEMKEIFCFFSTSLNLWRFKSQSMFEWIRRSCTIGGHRRSYLCPHMEYVVYLYICLD